MNLKKYLPFRAYPPGWDDLEICPSVEETVQGENESSDLEECSTDEDEGEDTG